MASVPAHSPPELSLCQTRVQAGLCVARHKDSQSHILSFNQAGSTRFHSRPLFTFLGVAGPC